MMPKIVSKSQSPQVLETTLAKQKQRRPCREYRCGTSQIPSEDQVRELSQLQSAKVGIINYNNSTNNWSILTRDKINRQTDRHNNSLLEKINKKLEFFETVERSITNTKVEKKL